MGTQHAWIGECPLWTYTASVGIPGQAWRACVAKESAIGRPSRTGCPIAGVGCSRRREQVDGVAVDGGAVAVVDIQLRVPIRRAVDGGE